MYFSRLITLALLFSSGVCGRDLWLRMRSEHFDLITDDDAGAGRQVLRWLEEIGQVLPLGSRENVPRVFVFRSEATFKSFASAWPESVAGYYKPDGDHDYIASWNNGTAFDRVILHEYVHLWFNRTGVRIPPWLNEGTADLYSASGAGMALGGAVPSHVATLQSNNWLDLPALFAVQHPSEIFDVPGGAKLFYAESWALAQMLKLGREYRDGMPSLLARLQNGASSEAALRETYGKTTDEILRDLRYFVRPGGFARITLKVRDPREVSDLRSERISPLESALELAGLQTAVSGYRPAEEQLRSLLPLYSNAPALHNGLAEVLLRQDRKEEALAEYEKAIQLGSVDARSYFEAAALLRDRQGDAGRAVAYLRRAIELAPANPDARELLGMLYLRVARDREAAEQLREAVRLSPEKMWTWQDLSVAEHNIGEKQRAIDAARRARALARTQPEIEMTEATIRLASGEPAQLPDSGGPDVFVPKSWENPQGDSRVEGELLRLDCLGSEARLHISSGGSDVALHVADPSKVVLINPPSVDGSVHVELACGDWKPARAVIVDYLLKGNPELQTAGEVTAVRFK
jgi:tetratricopeptide (TPR) repeat protein